MKPMRYSWIQGGAVPETLTSVFKRISDTHAAGLRWFARHEGDVGPRPWGNHRPSDAPPELKLVAQRGIHVPDGFSFALSVNSTRKSRYGDGKPLSLADGTWLLPYAEHAGGDGAGAESRWNRGLMRCLREHVPVGVTYELTQSQYQNMGLAFVEDYDPRAGFFLLHGPVRLQDQNEVSWIVDEAADADIGQLLAREQSVDQGIRRRLGWTAAREDQGQFRAALIVAYDGHCAMSGYDVRESLQAAHILSYSGRLSQVPENGLLLRADLHILFDEHLLAVEPDSMQVRLAPAIRQSRYSALNSQPLSRPRDSSVSPSREKLGVHYEVCRRAWEDRALGPAAV